MEVKEASARYLPPQDPDCPHGYKRTEVGMIPEDWDIHELSSTAFLVTGNTPPTSEKRNYGDKHLFVGPSDLGVHKWIVSSEKMLSDRGRFLTRVVPKNAVIFVCIGSTIGKTGMAAIALSTNQQITCAVVSDDYSPEFIYYALTFMATRISYFAGQQAVPIINKTEFGKSRIGIPPTKAEQEAIAGALSDTDALIESLERLIAKKRHIKQGAMQELLTGKRRLPGFENIHGYKETEVGIIPEDWRVETIGQISVVGRGRVISHKEIARSLASKFPVYSSQTSNSGVMGYLDTFDFEGEYITWTTDGANAGTVFYRDGKFNCTNVCGTIKLNSDNHKFVALVLGRYAPSHVSRHLGNPKLMNDVMKQANIPLPANKAEQDAIAKVLTDMDTEITALETKLAKLRQLKQGMMHELLTGSTRLVKPAKVGDV